MSIGNLKNITLEQILKELEKKNNLIYVSTNTVNFFFYYFFK